MKSGRESLDRMTPFEDVFTEEKIEGKEAINHDVSCETQFMF